MIAVASRHGSLRNSPPQDQHGHQYSVGDFDDEDRREGLPCECCNWGDRADEGVLIANESSVFLQTEDRAISENTLVENLQRKSQHSAIGAARMAETHLQEVDPDQDHQNHRVSLAQNALVLNWRKSQQNLRDRSQLGGGGAYIFRGEFNALDMGTLVMLAGAPRSLHVFREFHISLACWSPVCEVGIRH